MEAEDLKQRIIDYYNKAIGVECERFDIVKQLEDIMKNSIIPEISPHLPEDYSICPEKSGLCGVDINGNYASQKVPVSFSIELRLLYEGKPIAFDSKSPHKLDPIRNKLKLELKRLADKYGVTLIQVSGEHPEL